MHPNQPVEAVVGVDVRRQHALQDVGDGREREGERGVDRRPPLRVGAGEVDLDAFWTRAYRGPNAHRRTAPAVIVEEVLAGESPARKVFEACRHQALRVIEQSLRIALQVFATVALDQFGELHLAGAVGGQLRAQVACHLFFCAHVCKHQLQQPRVQLTALLKDKRRNDQSFLVNLA